MIEGWPSRERGPDQGTDKLSDLLEQALDAIDSDCLLSSWWSIGNLGGKSIVAIIDTPSLVQSDIELNRQHLLLLGEGSCFVNPESWTHYFIL